MKISTILDQIDGGHMALPEFQRGYVWNREQVRGLMSSLYRGHPVGSLLVWATQAEGAAHRGEGELAAGTVKLLLDGQQRVTSLYGITRGTPPPFFDGNADTFTGLHFHLGTEDFSFYSPVKMRDDPLWIDVSRLMQDGYDGIGTLSETLSAIPELSSPRVAEFLGRLSRILGVKEIDLHVEEVTGPDKTIEIDARLPGGASEQVVRTVTEHGRTLKFEPGSGGERDCRVTPEGQPPKRGRAPGRDDSPASGDARNTTERCEGWPHPASPPRWPLPSPPRGTPDRPAGRACSSPLRRGMLRRGRGAACCGLRCLPSATSSPSSAQPC